jgi:integrase
MPKITTRTVDATNAKVDRLVSWDSELKGFGLVALPTGVKSYVYQYRTPEGVKRRITIGQHGAWTAHQARRRAEELRQIVRSGDDPLKQKQDLRAAKTVGELLDGYLLSQDFLSKSPSTQGIDRGRIERHLRPLLGKRHAHLVTDQDVKAALNAIREGKTATDIKTKTRGRARVKGGAGTAREAIALLRVVFNWAKVKPNPVDGIKLGTSGTREIIMEDANDYARLFQTLDQMETERRIRGPVADAIRLIALTGCRRGEAAHLRWSQVELKRGRIVLPPSSHKTGRKTGKPRIIPLPAAGQAIISRQPFTGEDGYVFAPAKGDGALALSRVWALVREEAKLPKGIGLHGLRHSVASHLAMAGAEAAEIMAAMGHRQLSTVARYIHFAETAQQALAERAAKIAVAGMAAAKKSTL